jgi:two-component system chemotaxis response regulator CheB
MDGGGGAGHDRSMGTTVSPREGEHAVGYPAIALVASAGGLQPVLRILNRMPVDFGGAIIVLIHQAPTHVSQLVLILRTGCRLPVDEAKHGESLQPGRVVVVPPGRHLLVTARGRLALIPSGPFPPSRPSADLLLTTLATAVGPRAVAVILSGGGHDGATGASAVHAFGGTVFATDEASSMIFSMPQAAIEREQAVDRILPLADIPGALEALVSRAALEAPSA